METTLNRFLEAQKDYFALARLEIQQGRKESHWMWYIFPQLQGLGKSETSNYYGINDLQEAVAYLDDEILGPRLIEITTELLAAPISDATMIFGRPDDLKLKSSMTLFHAASSHSTRRTDIFKNVIAKFFDGNFDHNTEKLIEANLALKPIQSKSTNVKSDMKNYYEILGVEETAAYSEIVKAYQTLSSTYDPEKFGGTDFIKKLHDDISEAFSVLGNIVERREYDKRLEEFRNENVEGSDGMPPLPASFDYDSGTPAENKGSECFVDNEYEEEGYVNSYEEVDYDKDKYLNDELLESLDERDFGGSGIDYEPPTAPPPLPGFSYQQEKMWSASGRIGRTLYASRVLTSFAILMVISFIIEGVFNLSSSLNILLALVYLVFIFTQTCKRFHDVNVSGWWALLLLIPYVNLIVIILLCIIPGEKYSNKYGPSPKHIGPA